MRVVGVGAQGSTEDGAGFVAETGLASATVLFDADFRVWSHYEVTGQPTAILVDASGTVIHEFPGQFNADEVLQIVQGA